MEQLKTCSKCKAEFPIALFYEDKRKPGRFRSQCKKCFLATAEQSRPAYFAAHEDELRLKRAIRYANSNKAERNKRLRAIYPAQRQKLLARNSSWRKAHPAIVYALQNAWEKAHPEQVKNMHRESGRRCTENLSDGYVKKLLTCEALRAADITPEFIEERRELVKARRLYRQFVRSLKEQSP